MRQAYDLISIGRNEAQCADNEQRTEFAELCASFMLAEGVDHNNEVEATIAQRWLAGEGAIGFRARPLRASAASQRS